MLIKEILPYSRYTVKSYCNSKIDPSYTALIITHFTCPSCSNALEPLLHGESIVCKKCKLKMTLEGNALKCIKSMGKEKTN